MEDGKRVETYAYMLQYDTILGIDNIFDYLDRNFIEMKKEIAEKCVLDTKNIIKLEFIMEYNPFNKEVVKVNMRIKEKIDANDNKKGGV